MTHLLGAWGTESRELFDVGDIAQVAGWTVCGDFARGACPACSSATGGWGVVRRDGRARVGCFACGDWRALRSHLRLDGDAATPAPTFHVRRRIKSGPPALDMERDGDVLGRIYACMGSRLRMGAQATERHLGTDRGIPIWIHARMTPLWRALGPASGPDDDMAREVVSDLVARFDAELLGRVPELAPRRGGGHALLTSHRAATYLEPWADEHGRVVALRGYYRGGTPKYKATKGRTGPLVHVATGVARDQMANVPWLLTEGWMKAEVAAHALGVVAIAFPGVTAKGSWRRALRIKQRLAPDAPTYIAYDAEVWTTRPDIASLAFDLAREVRWTEGRCAGFAAWDADIREEQAEPKGIDDAIVAGREIHLVDRLGFGAYLAPAFERWDRRVAA